MTILLDAAYCLLATLASPFILFKLATSRRWRAGLAERLGGVTRRASKRPCIWIHAVSVGEINAARPLIDLLRNSHPDWDTCISTTTNTGQQIARKRYGADACLFFPLDLSFTVRRTFNRIRPDVIVLVELEIWPNFLRIARRRGVPVVIVNGRMREQTLSRYRLARRFFAAALDPASGNAFCVQNDIYRDRFLRAGFPAETVQVTGNMKYDGVRTDADDTKRNDLRNALGLIPGEPIWAAGSTWPGEEELCLRVYAELRKTHPRLRLVIAPRHVERADEVADVIARAGCPVRRRTAATDSGPDDPVVLLDTVGELGYLYSLADVVFVGKSLTCGGGHNILEPAAAGAATVFGPMMENFQEEAAVLREAQAADCVRDETELLAALRRLLSDAELRRRRAENARAAVRLRQGASQRNFEAVERALARRNESSGKGSR